MSTRSTLLLIGAFGLSALANEQSAEADVLVAGFGGGRAAWATDQACFQDEYGAATNAFCSTSPTYVVYPPNIPPPFEYANISVNVFQRDLAGPIECNVNLMNKNHQLVSTSAHKQGTPGQSTTLMFMFSSTQLTEDTVIGAACTVGPGARLNSVIVVDRVL